jgi:hypothetical protein
MHEQQTERESEASTTKSPLPNSSRASEKYKQKRPDHLMISQTRSTRGQTARVQTASQTASKRERELERVGEESLTLEVVHLEGNHRAADHPQRTRLPATASDQTPPATATAAKKGSR